MATTASARGSIQSASPAWRDTEQPIDLGAVISVATVRFSATETLDIGMDLGSTVVETYHAQAPFAFNGKINCVIVELKT